MRVIVVLVAVAAALGAGAAVVVSLLDEPSRPRAEQRATSAAAGPFALAERRDRGDTALGDLTARLRADVLVPAVAERRARVPDNELARRMLQATCRDEGRDCRQAVATSAIRRVWASMPRRGDPARKAARLLGLGQRLSLTAIQVRDSIRAELDAQLIRAVRAHTIGEPHRAAALTCFETPAQCRLTGS